VNRSFRLPLAASVIGHAGAVALLVLSFGNVPLAPLTSPDPTPGIVVTLAPSEPIPKPPPLPPVPEIPPSPEPPPPSLPPPPPIVEAPPPPPPPRPVVRPVRPLIVHKPVRRPVQRPVREETPPPMPSYAPSGQTVAVSRPPPARAAPLISAAYRAAVSAWLQSHKHYPESARARGEEGQVVLRFRVARSGQVLNYAVVQSSGYPELDAAVDAMMRGAVLPPFPTDMMAADIQVTVGVRFALTR